MKKLKASLEKKQKRSIEVDVTNINRAFGTQFGAEITKRYGDTLDADTYLSLIHI